MRNHHQGVRVALLSTLALAAAVATTAPAEANYRVKGRYSCENRDHRTVPLAGMKVAIWEDDVTNHKITQTFTDANGRFEKLVNTKTMDADDDDEVFLSLELDTSGGGVQVFNAWDPGTPWNEDTASKDTGPKGSTVNFKDRVWKSGDNGIPACSVFLGARRAADDFRAVTGAAAPFNYDVTYQFPAITPFTTTNETRWPADFRTGEAEKNAARAGFETSFHEFAHAFRATFDGNFAHFGFDASRFLYPQTHGSCDSNNEGFAFNEGWAEWWGKQRLKCADGPNMGIEGHVAGRLAVAESCVGRKTMVAALRTGNIHSFGEFQRALAKFNPGCAAKADPKSGVPAPKPQPDPGSSLRQVGPDDEAAVADPEASAAKTLAALRTERASLTQALGQIKVPATARKCAARACLAAADSTAGPAVLRSQIEQLDLNIKFVEDTMAALRPVGFTPGKAEQQLGTLRATLLKATGAAAVRGLAAAKAELQSAVKANGRFRAAAVVTLRRLAARVPAQGFSKGLPGALLVRLPSPDGV